MYNKKKKIITVLCIALCIMVVGYAAFSTSLSISGTANIASEWKVVFTKIEQVSKTTGVTEQVTPEASGTTATFNVNLNAPGDMIEYKITVENQGTLDAIIENINASETGNEAIDFEISNIKIGDTLTKKTSTTFNVKISYDSSITSQPSNTTNTLTVNITYVQDLGQDIEEKDPEITTGSTETLAQKLQSQIGSAQSDANIDFSYSSEGCFFDVESSEAAGEIITPCDDSKVTNGLYYTNTNTEDNKTTYYYRGVVENNYVKFGKLNESSTGCIYNHETVLHITDAASLETTASPTQEQCLSTNICDAGNILKNNYGMNYRYVTGLDAATCAYFGGTLLSDYAQYGNLNDIYWRIVRINEDGSIRLIYQGPVLNLTGDLTTIDIGKFNESNDDNAYVGYMYGTAGSSTYALTHSNTNDSAIKEMLDDWYEANLKDNYASYLADAGFCNDRSLDSGTGIGTVTTYYGAYNRLRKLYQPQFVCPNEGRDLFTTSASTKGNQKLTNPIGLITADEVAYAGGVLGESNESMYLTGAGTWTMSPFSFYGNDAGAWHVYGGNVGRGNVGAEDGVRPVVNLQSGVAIISGDGTAGNPYVIKTN